MSRETEAIDRMVQKRLDLGVDDFAKYAVLVLGILGSTAPDVLTFLLDRADEKLAPTETEGRP